MHSQLRKADVHGGHGEPCVGNMPQRRAAGHIGTVGKYLNRDMNGLAESAETGSSESIGSIVTVGVVLNDNAAV